MCGLTGGGVRLKAVSPHLGATIRSWPTAITGKKIIEMQYKPQGLSKVREGEGKCSSPFSGLGQRVDGGAIYQEKQVEG